MRGKGDQPQADSISFISHFCSLLIFKLGCKWLRKALSTHATECSLLTADLLQIRGDEGHLASAGVLQEEEGSVANTEVESPVRIYGSWDVYFIPRSPPWFVSVPYELNTALKNVQLHFISSMSH